MPRPGRACSSYLVRTPRAAVLLDLGSGALGKLQLAIDYRRLDAVVISHVHADHFLDVIPLRYGLRDGLPRPQGQMPLWLPPGGAQTVRALCNVLAPAGRTDFLDEVFIVREYDPSRPLEVNGLRLTFKPTRHYIEAFAVRAQSDGASIVYSADTAPSDAVVDHARDCSLFLCEATLGLGTEQGRRGHSSAREAGEMARHAGAARLVLTHYGAAYAPEALVDAAEHCFSGSVLAADDGMELSV
jgi:ribonuclease BN (tRNA processing enzyme)